MIRVMRRVRGWLAWSPFERGTWQWLALYFGTLVVIMTLFQLAYGFDWGRWIAALVGISAFPVVYGMSMLLRARR
jgi:uncharacterized membrane protein